MKLENAERQNTTLDDNAAIYAKRDTRDAKAKFKDLHGKAKWEFFRDYLLGKIVLILAAVGLGIYILYSFLAPKPETQYNIAVLDNIIPDTSKEVLHSRLDELLVTDPEKQLVNIDYDYYVSADSYSARMKLVTILAAGDIDCLIMPSYEISNYTESDLIEDLRNVLPDELIPEVSQIPTFAHPETGETVYAGIDITESLKNLTGYEIPTKYYIVSVSNSKRSEHFAEVVRLFLESDWKTE